MKRMHLDHETALEAGLGLFAAGLVGGLLALLFGRGWGGLQRGRGHHQAPPQAGDVQASRQQHIGSVSAR